MTKKEINELLKKAYRAEFLDKIEILTSAQREYRKSDFFKENRIELQDLFLWFTQNEESKKDLFNQINQAVFELNTDLLVEKAEELIDKLGGSEKVVAFVNDILESFDLEIITGYMNDLEEELKNLK